MYEPTASSRFKMNVCAFEAKHYENIASDFPSVKIEKIIAKLIFSIFFFNSVLRPFQDYFSSYETGQSVGGAKTGEPREKPPDTPASRTWLVSHVARLGLEPTPDTAVR